jgi:hypothetical protein
MDIAQSVSRAVWKKTSCVIVYYVFFFGTRVEVVNTTDMGVLHSSPTEGDYDQSPETQTLRARLLDNQYINNNGYLKSPHAHLLFRQYITPYVSEWAGLYTGYVTGLQDQNQQKKTEDAWKKLDIKLRACSLKIPQQSRAYEPTRQSVHVSFAQKEMDRLRDLLRAMQSPWASIPPR